MKTTNLPSGAQRNAEVGLVWREVITAGSGTIKVPVQGTVRIHATADTTVHCETVSPENLMITIRAGQIERINAGTGFPNDKRTEVTLVITGTADVQIAREIETGRRTK